MRKSANQTAILALDMGTSSTRAAIFDAAGTRIDATTAQIKYELVTGPGGRAELRPGEIEQAVTDVFARALKAWRKLGKGVPVAGIGVSCFWHSLMGLDGKGKVVTPIYTWADSRCRGDAERLRKTMSERTLHGRTGCMSRASFWPAKLLWLRRTEPALFRQVARWVSPAEWIQERWCGRATASLSMASGTGLLDGRTLRWDARLLSYCGLREDQLNAVSEKTGTVSPPRDLRFRELAGVAWFPALGDGAASNLGSGATSRGMAAINVGTSAALRVVVPRAGRSHGRLAPLGLFAYRIDGERMLLGGAVSNAGNLRKWATDVLKLPARSGKIDEAGIEREMRKRPGPSEHLTLLPFWLAERAPTWPEELPSAVMGISEGTSALDLLQALQEATYHRLAQIAEAVESAAAQKLAFVVSGGIQKSTDALQRLANVLGRPVYASAEPEASLRGAACLALERLGCHPERVKLGKAITPVKAAARAYAKARKRQVRLEARLRNAKVGSVWEA